jgi:hypothetical protein
LESLPPRTEAEEEEIAEEEARQQAEEEEARTSVGGAEHRDSSAGSGGDSKKPLEILLPVRDEMRIHILWILSSFFHVSPAMERDFLHQYQVSLVTMDLGLRPSLLHSLLANQQQLVARDKIYQHLMRTKELAQDEFIVDHAVVEFASSKQEFNLGSIARAQGKSDGLRVLILTNRADGVRTRERARTWGESTVQ